jgi:hypothetical protein
MLSGLDQKVRGQVRGLHFPPAQMASHRRIAAALPTPVTAAQRGKPVALPCGVGRPQGRLTGRRVKDRGASQRRPVMGRIGVEPTGARHRERWMRPEDTAGAATSPPTKVGRLPRGVGGREASANRRRGQSRTVGAAAMAVAGAAPATAVNSVAGPAVVTPRWTPRPMGQPRPARGVVGRRSRAGSYRAGTLSDA